MHADNYRSARLHGVADRRRRHVHGDDDMLAYSDARCLVLARCGGWRLLNIAESRMAVRLGRVSLDAKADPIVTHKLQRVRPHLHSRHVVTADERAVTWYDHKACVTGLGRGPSQVGKRLW